MADFPSHDLTTAPEGSKPLLEKSQAAFWPLARPAQGHGRQPATS